MLPQIRVKADSFDNYAGTTVNVNPLTINEADPNKFYEVEDISIIVPEKSDKGNEFQVESMKGTFIKFSSNDEDVPDSSDYPLKMSWDKTKVVDETGKDYTSLFNMQEGSFELNSSSSDFAGHTITIKLYGKIAHPDDYTERMQDSSYVSVAVPFFTLTMTTSDSGMQAPLYTSDPAKFLVHTVTVNYMQSYSSGGTSGLAPPIQYGGYIGDQYQTFPKDFPGLHLVGINGAEKGEFTEAPINVDYLYMTDEYSIDAQDSTLFMGDTWKAEDNFISATDIDGKDIDFGDPSIKVEGTVDTTTPGSYTITYSNHTASKTVTVTVKKRELVLTVPQTMNFGSIKLGEENKLFWPSDSKVNVQSSADQKWELSVKLSQTTNSDFNQFIKLNGNNLSTETVSIIRDSQGPETVTDILTNDKFIYVDYSKVTQLRSDEGNIEWTLTPSTKEIRE